MRVRTFVIALMLCAPALVHAQASDSTGAEHRRNVFAIQPWSSESPGPRLELERSVSTSLTLVLGGRLTLKNPAYAGRKPVFSEFDLGVRYYASGRAFHGPFAGLYGGYDRVVRDWGSQTRDGVPRIFLGATAGYDFVLFRRLIVGPALGLEYGRPSPMNGVRTWRLSPRIGFGLNFE